jgi:hypothetical protein
MKRQVRAEGTLLKEGIALSHVSTVFSQINIGVGSSQTQSNVKFLCSPNLVCLFFALDDI